MWIFIGIVSLVVFILIFREIQDKKLLETVTKRNRGTKTERDLVLKFLKYGIPAQTIFHDLYVKKHNGKFSQIDLVVATKVGIIVLEVKDYSGWIFGTGHNSQWTQVLAYGKRKYRLYNPIMQNSNHISDLKKQLRQFETVPFYSIVVFYGNCVLKDINFVPNGTFLVKSNRALEVMETLMENNELARYTNKNEIVHILKEAVKNGEDKETQIQHIKNVREMLSKDRIFD
ncbi:MAG TPA: nuclease-related domain-containing protein [Chitinophagaceae bacterium]|nr:nuclease-related domain-containing protein [Chitinophagaceae bacterium]